MAGEVAILNVGAGDTKLSFDPKNPAEVKRAARIVKDMIRSGYAILIEVDHDEKGPLYRRAHDFDEATAEYIIAGNHGDHEGIADEQEPAGAPRKGRKAASNRKPAPRRIPAFATNAKAVAKTSGG